MEPIVAALLEEWAAIDALLAGLPADAWSSPTCLPGWSVADVAAHIVGTESMLAGDKVPVAGEDLKGLEYVRNEIGMTNEAWVQDMRPLSQAQVLDRFRSVIGRRRGQISGMTRSDLDAPSWTPVGQATYGRFMQIRLFDCWVHEQDIRDAVGRPGHEEGPCAEGSVDEVVRALGYIVGKKAAAPPGSSVTIDLTGPVDRRLHVSVDGRASVVDSLAGPATASLKLASGLFIRLAGGRVDPGLHLQHVEMNGDLALAQRVVSSLAFTI